MCIYIVTKCYICLLLADFLVVWFQTLHDSTRAKLIVPFSTIESPAHNIGAIVAVCSKRSLSSENTHTCHRRTLYIPYDQIDYTEVVHLAVWITIRQVLLKLEYITDICACVCINATNVRTYLFFFNLLHDLLSLQEKNQ